jgi:transposase
MDFSNETSLPYHRAAAQALHDENVRLRQENERLQARLAELEGKNAALSSTLASREKMLFGKSSERRIAAPAEKAPRPKQVGHGPREQPELEVVVIEHELPESEQVCKACGGQLEPMGEQAEESELVGVTERNFVLEKHRRKKYRCRCNGCVLTAPGPLKLQEGGRYTPAFAVEVAVGKYADHLPLERQAQIMKREGLRIDSQTLWDQLEVLAVLSTLTYEAILKAVLTHPVIGADETWWPLLDNGKTKENKQYQTWAVVAPELVGYRILDSRSKQAASTLLAGYEGVVMADGYTVYQSLAAEAGTFTVANCWAHVRRKFVEVEKNHPEAAGVALAAIGRLYENERTATATDRAERRDNESRKVLDELFSWARSELARTLPRSDLAAALGYMLNLEPGLKRFLDDPRIPLDNNASERALRSVVVGRKNHYGSRSRRGTEVAAIFYTLMESAKLAGVSPKGYLLAVAEEALKNPGAVLLPADYKAILSKS